MLSKNFHCFPYSDVPASIITREKDCCVILKLSLSDTCTVQCMNKLPQSAHEPCRSAMRLVPTSKGFIIIKRSRECLKQRGANF